MRVFIVKVGNEYLTQDGSTTTNVMKAKPFITRAEAIKFISKFINLLGERNINIEEID